MGRRRQQSRFRNWLRRSLRIESLETRQVFAGDFHNAALPLDVSNDQVLSPLDALLVINDLNRNGTRELTGENTSSSRFIDTNNDDFVSPLDALLVINALNTDRQPPIVVANLVNDTGVQGNNEDGVTRDARIQGQVTDDAGLRSLFVAINGQPAVPIPVTPDGTFEFDPNFAADGSDDGNHVLRLFAEDTLRQVNDEVAVRLTLDTVVATPQLDLAIESDTGIVGDRLTTQEIVQLEGLAEANALVQIGNALSSATDASGAFRFDDVAFVAGVNNIELSITDVAGNQVNQEVRFARVSNDQAVGLLESDSFAQRQLVPIDLSNASGPTQLRLRLAADFDRSARSGLANDVVNVFVVDPSNPSQILLSGPSPASPVIHLDEAGDRFAPAIASRQGDDLLIDVSAVVDRPLALVLEFLSFDADRRGLAILDSVVVESIASAATPFAGSGLTPPVVPIGRVDVDQFTRTTDFSLALSEPRQLPGTNQVEAVLQLTNRGAAKGRQLALALRNLPPGVIVVDSESTDADDPLLNLSAAVPRGGLATGQSTQPIILRWDNAANVRFPIDLEVFTGAPNRPPQLGSIPPIVVAPGEVRTVNVDANDPDGDALQFQIRPLSDQLPSLTFDAATGQFSLRPRPDQIGQFEFEVVASDGVARTTQRVQVQVQSDAVNSTRVSGQVLDTLGNPLAGITANIGAVTAVTDAQGQFILDSGADRFDTDVLEIHGDEFQGDQQFPFVAERLELLFEEGRALFPNANNVIDRPIFLPALDVAGGTTVDPVVDTTVTQEIAPGAVAEIDVSAGTLFDSRDALFDGVLSITEVPVDLTPAALPPGIFPDTVVTIQPAELRFQQPAPLTLPNRGGFAAGTETELFSINPATGLFDRVGRGRVSTDGRSIETIEGGITNSSWHFFIPVALPDEDFLDALDDNPGNQEDLCDDCESVAKTASGRSAGTSEIELHSGALQETHLAATYQSLGSTRGVQLEYNSQRADLRPIVHFSVSNATGDFLVASATTLVGNVAVRTPGVPAGEFGLDGGEHLFRIPSPNVDVDAAIQVDLQGQPTGTYTVEIQRGVRQFNGERFLGTSDTDQVEVTIVNSVASPFGAGWDLAGFQQIVPLDDGGALLVDGDGTQLRFRAPQSAGESFVSPPGDFTTLERLPDGTFRRSTPDRTVFQFNATGQLETVTDRNGNITRFLFEADRLVGFEDAVGLRTTFRYTGERISQIEDPQGRITQLEHDAQGNLIRITDADASTRQFEYDQRHHLVAEVNQRGFREEAFFGFHGRATAVRRRDGSISQFNSLQTQGLFDPALTTNPLTAPAANVIAEAGQVQFADPNGNVATIVLDQAGQTRARSDTEGAVSQVTRNEDNLVVTQVDALGNALFFDYDDAGNRVRLGRSAFHNPIGGFANQQVDVEGDGIQSIELVDLDADGDLDVVATGERDRIYTLRNDGPGQWTLTNNLVVGATHPEDVSVVDVNGDGHLDLLARIDTGIVIFSGAGEMQFQAPEIIGLDVSPQGLATADVDQDGNLDVVVVGQNTNQIEWLVGDGQGGFAVRKIDIGGPSFDIAVADVNLDGHLDLIAATATDVLWLTGDSSDTFAEPVVISDVIANYTHVTIDDVNGDGVPDVIAASPSRLHVLIGDGTGDFDVQNLDTGTGQPTIHDVQVEDLNRDGEVDVVLFPLGQQQVVVFDNTGAGQFDSANRRSLLSGARTTALDVGDVDGDGDLDAVVGNGLRLVNAFTTTPGGLTVIENTLDGRFFQQVLGTSLSEVVSSQFADINGDGVLDLLSLGEQGDGVNGFVTIQIGSGNAVFGQPTTVPLGIRDPSDLTTGDFNGDGRTDLAVVSGSEPDVRVLFARSDSGFAAAQTVAIQGRGEQIEAGDFNEDGRVDLAVTFNNPRQTAVFISQNEDRFQRIDVAGDFQGRFDDALQVVDVNGDENLDLVGVTGNRFFAEDNAIFSLGDGLGGFQPAVEVRADLDATAATFADLNEDGLNDLIVVGRGVSVRLAQAAGGFGESMVTSVDSDTAVVGLEVFDWDADGDLDVVTVDRSDQHLLVFQNEGDGTLLPPQAFVAGDGPGALAAADLDFDGDLDVVIANDSPTGNYLVTNHATSLCPEGSCDLVTEYDADFNQVNRIVDELGAETRFELDPANGNTLRAIQVLGQRDAVSGEFDDIVESFTYTDSGLLATEVDPLGRTTRTIYNDRGLPIEFVFAEGTDEEARLRREYDAAGNVIVEIDESGHRTEFAYDALNRLVRQRDALGGEVTRTYDTAGNLIRIVDQAGNATEFEYDRLDRLIQTTDALQGVTRLEYDAFGNLIGRIDPLGRRTVFRYDGRDRLIETIDPLGNSTEVQYDAVGNVVRRVDSNGQATTLVYDGLQRNVAAIDALGAVAISGFDARSSRLFEIDPLGRRTDNEFDTLNRLVAVHHADPDGEGPLDRPVSRFVYDAAGNTIQQIDSLGRITESQYDARNRVVTYVEADPDGAGPLARPVTRFEYDARSLQIRVVDPIGRVTESVYDPLGRRVQVIGPDPDGDGPQARPVSTTEYDRVGNPIASVDPLGNRTQSIFDPLNRLVTTIAPDPDGDGPLSSPVTEAEFDAAGQLTSTIDALGRITQFIYDAGGRLVEQLDPDPDGTGDQASPRTRFEYDSVGNRTASVDPRGFRTEIVFDAVNRVVQARLPDPDGAGPLERPVQQNIYDQAGQLVTTIDALGRQTDFEFDGLGRVVRTIEPDPDGDGPQSRPVTQFELDLLGNVVAIVDPLGNRSESVYDNLNRLVESRSPDPDGEGPAGTPTVRNFYDAAGQLTRYIDTLGQEYEITTDGLGRIVQIVEPDPDGAGPLQAPVIRTEYDLVGNELATTDALGNVTRREYDNLYRLVRIVDADPDGAGPQTNPVTRFQYDAAGQLISQTNPLGQTTRYTLDALGRRIEQVSPDPDGPGPQSAAIVAFEYDANGNRTAIVDALGNRTRFDFDGLNRNTQIIGADPDGAGPQTGPRSTFEFDVAGQLKSSTDPLGRTTTLDYDGLGRVIQETRPDPDGDGPAASPVTRTTYDLVGNVLSTADALGNTTEFEYDRLYRQVLVRDPLGGETHFEFDLADNQTALIDSLGNRTTWSYDNLNRVIEIVDPLGNRTQQRYDAEDRLVERIDRSGRTVRREYDGLNRRVAEQWIEADQIVFEISFTFDSNDQLISVQDAQARYDYVYDQRGRRTSERVQIVGLTVPVQLDSQFDAEGNRVEVAAEIDGVADFLNRYTFDGLNRTQRIEQVSGGTREVAPKRIDFQYDASSQLQRIQRSTEVTGTQFDVSTDYQFDDAQRLVGLTHASAIGDVLSGYQWTFDAADRITSSSSSQDGESTFGYDASSQLIQAAFDFQSDEQFEFDAGGNRSDDQNAVGANNRALSDGTFDYDYDAEGNRIRRTRISTGETQEYTWDYRNRLVRVIDRDAAGTVVQDVRHFYDAFNRWLGSEVDSDGEGPLASRSQFYVYQDQNIVLDFDGSAAEDLNRRYLWGAAVDQLLAEEVVDSVADNDVLWPLGDHQNTIRDLARPGQAGQGATIVNHLRYGAFGQLTEQTDAAISTLFGYTGRPVDQATGLQNNINRWYDPQLGRWISEDPAGFEAGDPNLNRYVGNNPLGRVDPNGLQGFDIGFLNNLNPVGDPLADARNGFGLLDDVAGDVASAVGNVAPVVEDVAQAAGSTGVSTSQFLDNAFDLISQATDAGIRIEPDRLFEAARQGRSFGDLVADTANAVGSAAGDTVDAVDNLDTFFDDLLANPPEVAGLVDDVVGAADDVAGAAAALNNNPFDNLGRSVVPNVSSASRVQQAIRQSSNLGLLDQAGNALARLGNSRAVQGLATIVNSAPGRLVSKGLVVADVVTVVAGVASDLYVFDQRGQVIGERIQHEQNLDRIREARLRQRSEENRLRNQQILRQREAERIANNEAIVRQRNQQQLQDAIIRDRALAERQFLEEQRARRRSTRLNVTQTDLGFQLPPDDDDAQGADRQREENDRPAPSVGPSVETTGGQTLRDFLQRSAANNQAHNQTALDPGHDCPNEVFDEGFESGDVTAWR